MLTNAKGGPDPSTAHFVVVWSIHGAVGVRVQHFMRRERLIGNDSSPGIGGNILTWARGDENVILIQNSEGEQIAGLSDRQPADAASAVALAEDLSADFARKLGMKPNNVEKTVSFARDGKYRSTLVFKVDDK